MGRVLPEWIADLDVLTGREGVTGPSGAPGATGYKGLQGVPGLEGPTGIQGTRGSIGPLGYTGSQGITGSVGDTGAQGATGTQGTAGQNGLTGAQGETGAIGAPGVQGITGAQGDTGAQGYTGAQGETGQLGCTGVQGATGVEGLMGAQGVTGVAGVAGTRGVKGATGTEGSQGFTGSLGAPGARGQTGLQGTTGTQGMTGTLGLPGAQGPTGTQGATGLQGTQGLTGTQGYIGLKGATGSDGATGDAGPVGRRGSAFSPPAWESILTEATTTGYEACYGNGVALLPCGNNSIRRSSDGGYMWSTTLVTAGNDITWKSTAYVDGCFILSGSKWLSVSSTISLFFRSIDNGASWAQVSAIGGSDPQNGQVPDVLVVPGGGLLVTGRWYSADNGSTWLADSIGTFVALSSLAYGGGVFLGVSSGTTILRRDESTPGWTVLSSPGSGFTSLTYGSGLFLLTGTGVSLQSADNGSTWQPCNLVPATSPKVEFGGGKFYAYSSQPTTLSSVQWSSDGALTWYTFPGAPTGSNTFGIGYGNGVYFTGGSILARSGLWGVIGATGAQGTTGTQGLAGVLGSTGPTGFTGMPGSTGAQGPNGIAGLTGGAGLQGPQGPTGANGRTGADGPVRNDNRWYRPQGYLYPGPSAFGQGLFIVASSSTANVQVSDSGGKGSVSYTPAGASAAWTSVAYGDGIFMISGTKYMRSSDGGANWAVSTLTLGTGTFLYGGGVFLCVGGGVNCYRSLDKGLTWSTVALSFTILKASFADGVFVASYAGGVAVSTDLGLSWSQTAQAGTPVGVCAGNGSLLSMRSTDTFISTNAGASWAPIGKVLSGNMVFGNNEFMEVSLSGSVLTTNRSVNGTTWAPVPVASAETALGGLSYGNGVYIASPVISGVWGYPGPSGVPGAQGITGVQGAQGFMVSSAYMAGDSTSIYPPALGGNILVYAGTTSAACSVVLPSAVGYKGTVTVRKTGSSRLVSVYAGTGGQTLNGSAGTVSWNPASTYTFASDGVSGWYTVDYAATTY